MMHSLVLLFCQAVLFWECVLGALLLDEKDIPAQLAANKKVVGFYNVFAAGKFYDGIVQNQVKTINGSGLLDRIDNIYYVTMGNEGKEYSIGNSDKYVHLAHHDTGTELHTLSLLHDFCHENPNSKVFYFHNKGSFHPSPNNAKFCSLLNCYVLNPNCLDALEKGHDICGLRMAPIPNPHYSGNFWWARCSYINTLIHPFAPFKNATLIAQVATLNECMGFQDRFFSEAWIGTGPKFLPADCLNSTIDTTYVHGYHTLPENAFQFCHGPEKLSGLTCSTASTFVNTQDFRTVFSHSNALHQNHHCRDNRAEIIKTSRIINNNQDPITYIEWMKRIYSPVIPVDGSLLRFSDSAMIFIVEKGVLRGIPNGKTFMSLGRDFSDAKGIYASEKSAYTFGSMLPTV